MSDDEILIVLVSLGLLAVGLIATSTWPLHPLHLRNNGAVGLVRCGVAAAMAWIAFVLANYADPSVTGEYVFMYLVMGAAATLMFGLVFVGWNLAPRLRMDVYEFKNPAAGIFLAAYVLAVGLIFGGSLWGEADPHGDDEGGWWIPLGFFLMGWAVLSLSTWLYMRRGRVSFAVRIRQDRNFGDGQTAACYILSIGIVLTESVAGDFFGWVHGALGVALIGVMIGVHELFETAASPTVSLDDDPQGRTPFRQVIEGGFYLLLAGGFWMLHRTLESWTTEGVV